MLNSIIPRKPISSNAILIVFSCHFHQNIVFLAQRILSCHLLYTNCQIRLNVEARDPFCNSYKVYFCKRIKLLVKSTYSFTLMPYSQFALPLAIFTSNSYLAIFIICKPISTSCFLPKFYRFIDLGSSLSKSMILFSVTITSFSSAIRL